MEVKGFLKEKAGRFWQWIKIPLGRLGCLIWILSYLGIAVLAGIWVHSKLNLLGWWPDNGLWQVGIWTAVAIVGAFVFCVECGVTFLIMIGRDPNYDNPSPFPITPLDKRSGP